MKQIMEQYGNTLLAAVGAILLISLFVGLLIPGGKLSEFVGEAFVNLNFTGKVKGVDGSFYDILRPSPEYDIRTAVERNRDYSIRDIFVPKAGTQESDLYVSVLSVSSLDDTESTFCLKDKNGNRMRVSSVNTDVDGAKMVFLEEGYYRIRYTVKNMKTGGEENASCVIHSLTGEGNEENGIIRKKADI
ncbi:MAG: hypothetical protein IIZ61_06545 [Lachnospiraceae bacterium]|nr:hypothetical protein [Lachnospiraceae bacterium]